MISTKIGTTCRQILIKTVAPELETKSNFNEIQHDFRTITSRKIVLLARLTMSVKCFIIFQNFASKNEADFFDFTFKFCGHHLLELR